MEFTLLPSRSQSLYVTVTVEYRYTFIGSISNPLIRSRRKMEKGKEDAGDVVWGAQGIAGVIQRSVVATNHLLQQGALPAKKVAGRWVASRRRLLEHLVGEAA